MATIMTIGAHPDDLEIGTGAMILKAKQAGQRVVCVDLTDGEETPHGSREIRPQETAKANELLGIEERVCLHLPNRTLMDTEEARMRLATEMRRTQPNIILSHIELDAHPDHVAAFHITRGAILLSRIVKLDNPYPAWRPGRVFYFLCSHLRHAYDPSVILPVSEKEYETKIAAIMAYQSQFVWHQPNGFVEDMIRTRMKYFGGLIRQPYGEAYVSQEPLAVPDLFFYCLTWTKAYNPTHEGIARLDV